MVVLMGLQVSSAYVHLSSLLNSRIDRDTVVPIVVRGVQPTLGRRLEATAVRVLLDVLGLVVYDGLDERREVLVLVEERVVHRELSANQCLADHSAILFCTYLVARVTKPLSPTSELASSSFP
jgi:hypothetical protein